ncbi:MAG: TrmH family RNA methyltransferase, partial [Anaerolineales bacterium]
RSKTSTFFVEGVNAINQALAFHWQIDAFVYIKNIRLSDWATGILQHSTANNHYELPFELMKKISQKEDASELIAIPYIPPDDLHRIPASDNPLIVVLDRIASPGNLGTIIRSCDALGVDGVILTGHSSDLYAPETIRATTGSFFAVPVIRVPSPKTLSPWIDALREEHPQLEIVATSANSDKPLDNHDFKRPTILLIGNENHGLSVFYRELADYSITIPMSGSASSLNVACATTVILYEINRQRSVEVND